MSDCSDKLRIILLGEEYHAKNFNDQLENYGKSYFEPIYIKHLPSESLIAGCDLFHLISAPLLVIKKLRSFNKPIIYHWIGTDVYRLINDSFVKRFLKKLIINSPNVYNLVVSENLKKKLSKFSIYSDIIPLTKLEFTEAIPTLPEKFSVLSYVPEHRWNFYYGDLIVDLSLQLPDIDFHIVAAGKKNINRKNLYFYEFVDDIIPFYKKCSVLLRFTKHDGLPKMVLEALSLGRQVLWNEPFAHCIYVQSRDECISSLKKLKDSCQANLEGRNFVQKNFNNPKIISDYLTFCKKIMLS